MHYNEWVWSNDLITNEETVDYQHQTLFRTINDLIRACNISEEPNGLLVEVALDELLKYAVHHFNDEQNTMQKHNYPKLSAHKEQHALFAKAMTNFKERFDRGENVANDLITYMQNWLVNHIMTLDKEAMKYCIK